MSLIFNKPFHIYFYDLFLQNQIAELGLIWPNLNQIRLQRAPALFPPEAWNVYRMTLEGHERTNNAMEGWNNSFRNLIGHTNPSLWTLIKGIKQDQMMALTTITQIERGIQINVPKKRKYKALQDRLQRLCREIRDGHRSPESNRTLYCFR